MEVDTIRGAILVHICDMFSTLKRVLMVRDVRDGLHALARVSDLSTRLGAPNMSEMCS